GNGEAVEVPPEWAGQLTDQFAKVLKKGCDEDGVMIAPVLPNRIVKTGRGLQLWFDFAPVSFKAVKMVETVAKALCDAYEKFNDEYAPLELDRTSSMDIAGFKRMPGSYNWAVPVGGGKYYKVRQQKRPGRKDQTIEDMMAALGLKVYSAEERAAWKEKHAVSSDTKTLKTSTAGTEAAGIKTEEPVKAEKIKAKRKNIRSRKSAYAMLDVLLENAKYTDERNNYAFIAGTVALEAGMDVSAYLHELNKKFYDPLPARELEKTARSAASGRYHYALKTIAARLRLEISLFGNGESGAFVPNDIRNKKRAERRKQRNEKVMALLAGGLSITETAEKAGLCRSTVRKIRERMRALKNAISERNARSKKLFRETFIPRAVSCIENRYEDKDRVYAVPLFLTP
ncbi:MAG: primase C-terminal domain-containing protein, partial [Candidatus Weimeria sp.]